MGSRTYVDIQAAIRPQYEEFVLRPPLREERRNACRLKEFDPSIPTTTEDRCVLKAGHLGYCKGSK